MHAMTGDPAAVAAKNGIIGVDFRGPRPGIFHTELTTSYPSMQGGTITERASRIKRVGNRYCVRVPRILDTRAIAATIMLESSCMVAMSC